MTVYLLTQTYLNADGSREIFSGIQRYIRELTRLLVGHGFDCAVIQKSRLPFDRVLCPGVRVIGIPASARAQSDPYFNYRAHELIPPDSPVIYCLVELTYPILRRRSVAVQHGLWWDGEFPAWKRFAIQKINQRALRRAAAVICVDTNYINWSLGVLNDYNQIIEKCHYIPNFVDSTVFRAEPLTFRNGNTVMNVLFPRRCEPKRGATLFLDACIDLWQRGEHFHATFCGWGSMQRRIDETAARSGFSHHVEVTDVDFDSMPELYRKADIVVVPTMRHEGTSLSCLEALHMGKPVITTFVGGLPNLVLPGVNGELVPPKVSDLSHAIARLLHAPSLRKQYGTVAHDLAQAFTLDKWSDSIWKVIAPALSLAN